MNPPIKSMIKRQERSNKERNPSIMTRHNNSRKKLLNYELCVCLCVSTYLSIYIEHVQYYYFVSLLFFNATNLKS